MSPSVQGRCRVSLRPDRCRRPFAAAYVAIAPASDRQRHPCLSVLAASAKVKHEGCPDGRAFDHWSLASAEERKRLNELMYEEEKVLADRPDANLPALLTQDVHGG